MLFFCPACKQNKPLSEFHADHAKANGRSTYCAICGTAKAKQRRLADPDREKAIRRQFYARNRKKLIARRKAAYNANRAEEQRKARERYRNNPEIAKARHRRVKLLALAVVSPKIECAYCGESDPSKLEIDHVLGDGSQHRTGRYNIYYSLWKKGVPENTKLQVLCEKHNGMKIWLSDTEFRTEVKKLALIL